MKYTFLKLKTNSLLKKNKGYRASTSYAKAKTIGIIFTVEDKQKHFSVKEFIKQLEHDEKHVQVLEYLPEQHDNYEFKFDFFSEKDLSFWGHLNSASATQFTESPFDFLFYLDLTPNPLILHLLAKSKAKCRIGKLWENGEQYFEMMIGSVNTNQALIDAVYQFVKQLR